jgi:hypothetical protein
MLGVERVGDSQDGGQLVHDEPLLPIEGRVGDVAALRNAPAVIARDIRNDGRFVVRQPEDL